MRERLISLPVLAGGAALAALVSIFGCNPNRNNTDLYRNQSSGTVADANSQTNANTGTSRSDMNTPQGGYGTAGQNTAGMSGSNAQQPGAQPSGGPAAYSSSQMSSSSTTGAGTPSSGTTDQNAGAPASGSR